MSSAIDSLEVNILGNNNQKHISVASPDTLTGRNNAIVFLIDSSYSMGASADKPSQEKTGLTVLEICIYGTKAAINGCDETSSIMIAKFSDKGEICCNFIKADTAGKEKLFVALDRITPDGSTNLLDGINVVWNSIATLSDGYQTSLIVFTDGQPNHEPLGYITQLKNKKEYYGGKYPCDINIYTYGNRVNSELSDQISRETGGVFGFMSDASLIGDLLIHKVANILSTRAKQCVLKIETSEFIGLEGYAYTKHSWGIEIQIGDILYGQNRDVAIECGEITSCQLVYNEDKTQLTMMGQFKGADNDFAFHYSRQKAVEVISIIINFMDNGDYQAAEDKHTAFIQNLLFKPIKTDFEGQIKMAFKPEFYQAWGKHYLLSIRRAYQLQQSNNFKDEGVQIYGGKFTKRIIDKLDDIFNTMPPPTARSNAHPTARSNAPQIDMTRYNSRMNDGCFHGSSIVYMVDGSKKRVDEIVKGDLVSLGNGLIGEIECVAKTEVSPETIKLIKLNDELILTEYHPVKPNCWEFPKNIHSASYSDLFCDAIYSFVLKKDKNNDSRGCGSGIIIGNIECATLGHGINEDVIYHPFFGSELVINALKGTDQYPSGLVILKQNSMIRDPETCLICGINFI